jgi:hypothetical protein
MIWHTFRVSIPTLHGGWQMVSTPWVRLQLVKLHNMCWYGRLGGMNGSLSFCGHKHQLYALAYPHFHYVHNNFPHVQPTHLPWR